MAVNFGHIKIWCVNWLLLLQNFEVNYSKLVMCNEICIRTQINIYKKKSASLEHSVVSQLPAAVVSN
jgi:hypothetical protein